VENIPKYICYDRDETGYRFLDRVFYQFPKYHMKILLGDFSAKLGREDIFKPIKQALELT